MTRQDLKGVMACFAEKAAIMGTGPGEIWVGPDEIQVPYEHFFEGFDKGEQNFEYQFKIGGVTADMGWLMASGNMTRKEGREGFCLPNKHLVDRREKRWQLANRGDAFLHTDGSRWIRSERNELNQRKDFSHE